MGSRLILLGASGLVVSFWGLAHDVGFIAQPFYAYAWWSYILVLDGFVWRRRKSSLLTTRRKLVPSILLWSITFWYFFELLNLRYQNWYYVGVFGLGSVWDFLAGTLFGAAAFSTVFMGLFETYEALTAVKLASRVFTRPRTLAPWLSYAIQGLGAVMVTLSIAFPTYLAPLVWGSLTFLVDPWNYRRGARSILADLERGELGNLLRLLAAGLACGLVWESFNFLAPQKWIYTVRGLEGLKLFEMPLLGFLGFPALALDAFAAYAAVSYRFHGNETWENPEDVAQVLAQRPAWPPRAFAALVPVHLVFWSVTGLMTLTTNVGSVELELSRLETLPSPSIPRLAEEGIRRPRQLLSALEDPERRARLASLLSLTDSGIDALYQETRLLTFKGIGYHHGELLRRLGYRRVEDLAGADPDELYRKLEAARGDVLFPALRPGMVRVWVHAAGLTSREIGSR